MHMFLRHFQFDQLKVKVIRKLAKHPFKTSSNILPNDPSPIFRCPDQVIFRVVNRMARSFQWHAPMVSQPGPASGRLNISSPLKERGFHVRFSDQQKETALVKHFDGFFSWLYLLDRDIGEVHSGVTPFHGRSFAPSYPRLSMDLLNRYRTTENKKAAYVAAFRLIIILYRTSLDYELVEGRGIEPPTSTLRTSRSPN